MQEAIKLIISLTHIVSDRNAFHFLRSCEYPPPTMMLPRCVHYNFGEEHMVLQQLMLCKTLSSQHKTPGFMICQGPAVFVQSIASEELKHAGFIDIRHIEVKYLREAI